VNTVVGDPLMRFRTWVPGDVNLDGIVSSPDLARILTSLWRPGTYFNGDLNGDAFVNSADLNILLQNWMKTASAIPGSPTQSTATTLGSRSVPEPGPGALLIVGWRLLFPLRRR
jgi:hypothetical protein